MNRLLFGFEPILLAFILLIPGTDRAEPGSSGNIGVASEAAIRVLRTGRNEDDVSKYIERWKELAFLCLGEQDPVKLTELANEMNLAITQKNTVPRSFAARAFRITVSPDNHKRELRQITESAP